MDTSQDDWQPVGSAPASAGDDDWQDVPPPAPSTATDVGKTLVGNVAPNAVGNLAANLASPAYTAASYALQLGAKGGEYLGEGLENLNRMATGKIPKTQADYDEETQATMNLVRSKMGLPPTDSGDISGLVPSPANLVSGAAKLAGHPLYQPKTQIGRDVEAFGNVATGGAGSGAKLLPTIAGATASTVLPEVGKESGLNTPAEQYLLSLAGGLGGGAMGEKALSPSPETAMGNAEDNAIDTLGASSPSAPKVGSAELRARAKPYYDYSKNQGVSFTPEVQSDIPSNIEAAMAKTGKMNANLHGDTLSVLGDMKNDADQGNLDLETVHQYRQLFGDVINNNLHPNGTMKPDAMKANQAIDSIDDVLDSAKKDPSMLSAGGPDAIEAWQKGQQLWGASARANDIERVLQRAELMQNPATSMRQGFASLAGNPKRFNRFPPEQQELIRDAAQSSLGAEAMRAIGSRLVTYSLLGAHNPLGAAAAIPISAMGRSLAATMQGARGQKVIDNIAQNAPGEFVPPAPQKAGPPPLQLPSPAINVPSEGFGPQKPPETPPPINYNPSQRALPPPQDMTYDDMVRSGRILQSPGNTPINLPDGPVRSGYIPSNPKVGDERGFAGAKFTQPSDKDMESSLYKKINSDFPAAVDEYSSLPDTAGGKILNTDSARELSPDYLGDRSKSSAVHEPASYFAKRLYQQKLAEAPKNGEEPVVLFTAGGTGAGKSTAVKNVLGDAADKAQIVYDTNMNKFDSSKQKVDDALNAGKGVHIVHVYRDPVDALANGALPRAQRQEESFGTGRTVPIQEHINTHVGSVNTVKRLAEIYKNDPRVSMTALDNSYGRNQAKEIPVENLPNIDQTGLKQRLMEVLDGQYKAGKISAKTYQGFAGEAPEGTSGVRPEDNDVSKGLGPTALRQSQSQRNGGRNNQLSGYNTGGRINLNPTDAQKSAGNYKKLHRKIYGLDITIENPRGSLRSGVGGGGKKWACKLPADYGYIRGTEASDGDHVDVYVGPKLGSPKVFVIDQVDKDTGHYDEAKVMLGYMKAEDAMHDYCKAFSDGHGHDRMGSVTAMNIDQFKDWLKNGDTKNPMEKAA